MACVDENQLAFLALFFQTGHLAVEAFQGRQDRLFARRFCDLGELGMQASSVVVDHGKKRAAMGHQRKQLVVAQRIVVGKTQRFDPFVLAVIDADNHGKRALGARERGAKTPALKPAKWSGALAFRPILSCFGCFYGELAMPFPFAPWSALGVDLRRQSADSCTVTRCL
jgi:hypothetical protein